MLQPKTEGELDLVDSLVEAAHERPLAAITMVGRDAVLATERSSWGENALQAASHLGHQRLLAHLRRIGVLLDIFAACAGGDLDLIRSEWRGEFAGATGIHDLPLLHFAVVSRDPAVVELLLGLGATPNPPGASLSPLHTAVAVASAAMIERLLMAGANASAVDAFGSTPLDWACELWGPDSHMLRLLAAAG